MTSFAQSADLEVKVLLNVKNRCDEQR